MFVRQAAMQFELFTGRKADLDAMREILRRALSPLNYKDEEETKEEPKDDQEEEE